MQTQHPVEEISLTDICLNRETQVRASVDEETIIRYFDVMVDVEARDKFPPVTLFRDGSGKLWLADGHHRIMAALRRKFPSILAVVRPGTKEDAIWEAASANSRNGLPLGRADVRRAVIMVLETFPNKSLRSIAEAVGCSKSYVEKVKVQVSTSGHLMEPASTQVEGKDGKKYSAKKNKKPKAKTTSTASSSGAATTLTEPPTKVEMETTATDIAQQSLPDSHLIEANVKRTQIHDTISQLKIQLAEWFAIAPKEQYEDFDRDVGGRLRTLYR